jgi:NAD(P)-dependent dehydrogenase (short-subunit alcohol dehydrogenase family)
MTAEGTVRGRYPACYYYKPWSQRGKRHFMTFQTFQTQTAKTRIESESGNSQIHTMKVDLSLQKDVRRFAREVDSQFPKIHYLISNAGIGTGPMDQERKINLDGHEQIMATNYLGNNHHNLLNILRPVF